MIETQRFSYWMGVFSAMADRALLPEELSAYHAVLSERLTTEEFEYAARSVLATHRYNSVPRPADFLAAVQTTTSPQVDAGAVWDQVVAIVLGYRPAGYSMRQREAEVEATLGEVARRALQSAGGAARLLRLEERQQDYMRREFVTAFGSIAETVTATEGVARLTGGRAPHRLAPGSPLALGSGDLAPTPAVDDEHNEDHGHEAAALEDARAWLAEHPEEAAEVARRLNQEVPNLPGLARTREIRTAQLAADLRAELLAELTGVTA